MKKKFSAILVGLLALSLTGGFFVASAHEANISPVDAASTSGVNYSSDLAFSSTSQVWTRTTFDSSKCSYYSSMDWSKTGSTLETSLATLLNGSRTTTSYDGLKTWLPQTDLDSEGTGKLVLFYNGQKTTAEWDSAATWNREHCWPDSRGAGKSGLGSDPHMIRPAPVSGNSSRGNDYYGIEGDTGSVWDPACVGLHSTATVASVNQYRGAAARIIFYCETCYGPNGQATVSTLDSTGTSDTSGKTMGSLTRLLEWNDAYPPDADEMYRNERTAYLSGVRNPFIDYPSAAQAIYGDGTAVDTTVANVTVASSSVSVAKGSTVTDQATANNFGGTATWAVSSADSSVATATVSTSGLVTVTGVKGGSTSISVTGTYGTTARSASIAVTVTSTDPTITISSSSINVTTSGTNTATVSATNFTGTPTYSVSSSASGVATGAVSGATLTVTGVAEGTATLTVTATSGSETASATIGVTVAAPSTSATITPSTTNMPTAYPKSATEYTLSGLKLTLYECAVYSNLIQFHKSDGYILNAAAFSNPVSSIVLTLSSPSEPAPTITYGSTSSLGTTATSSTSGAVVTYTLGSTASFIKILNSDSSALTVSSIQIYFSTTASKTLSSIQVTTMPSKTSYTSGEALDTSGIAVTGTYSDSTTGDVTASCTYSPATVSTVGTEEITVTCGSVTTTFNVTVSAAPTLSSISVTTNPTKTSYYVGDAFDSTGLVVTGNYSGGTSSVISSGYTLSSPDMSSAGTKTITVTYETFTDTFDISVVAPTTTGIAVATNPTKMSYTIGDTFDSTGLVVNIVYDSGATAATTAYTLSSPDMSSAGTKTITVTYTPNTSFTATFDITVSEASSTYTLVTSSSQLVLGSNVIIAASSSDVAMSTTQDDSDRNDATITKKTSDNTASFASDAGVCEFVLMKGLNDLSYSFYDPSSANNGFIAGSGSSTKTCLTKSALSANSTWTIAVTAEGVATITASAGTAKILSYNTGSTFFRCYSAVQSATALYVKSATSATIASEAKGWSRSCYATLTSLCTSTQQAASTPSKNLTTTWTTESGLFSNLTSSAQAIVKGTSSTDADVVAARALYYYILNKYGTGSLSNFLGMTLSSNPSQSVDDGSDGEWAALIMALIASLGLAGAVTLRKKKHLA